MVMKPPPRTKMQYEKVNTEDWVTGIIEDIQRDEKRDTGFKDEETGEPLIKDCIRFKFKLEGYNYPHYSRWMTFSYHEKAGLMKKYLFNLVEGAQPDMDFDIERFKNLPVKLMWSNNGDFQNIEMIRPLEKKIDPTVPF
jgi:hypothetical protein